MSITAETAKEHAKILQYYAVEQKAALQSRLQTLKIRLSLMIW